MADIPTSAPIAIRRLGLRRLSVPRLGIGASFAAISGLLGDAIRMAYLEPYAARRGQPRIAKDDDPEGRDPTW